MVSTLTAFFLISVSSYENQIRILSKKLAWPSDFSFRTMAGPSCLRVAFANINRMLLENVDDSRSTNLRKSRYGDVDYSGRKMEIN